MPTMVREAWTDERLDDLTKHMDEGFREVREELRQQRGDMAQMMAKREKVDIRLEAQQKYMDARFDDQRNHMDTSFNALMRTMQIGFSLIGVLIAGLMTLVGIWLY
jgi:hypothetical protein